MKTLVIFLLIIITSFSSMSQSYISNDLDNYLKKTFKNSILFNIDSLGYHCDANVYFVQGYNADGRINQRQIVFEKAGLFTSSNRFFFWCENLAMINYNHESSKDETFKDFENLLITYEDGKFSVTDVLVKKAQAAAIENEEHIGAMGHQYVSFQEYIEQNECKNL